MSLTWAKDTHVPGQAKPCPNASAAAHRLLGLPPALDHLPPPATPAGISRSSSQMRGSRV
eukprot:703897-Rhodomonas_salina.3